MQNKIDIIFLRKFMEFIELEMQDSTVNAVCFEATSLSDEQIDQVNSLYPDYAISIDTDPISHHEKGEVPVFLYCLRIEDMSKYEHLLNELGVEKKKKFNILRPRYLIDSEIIFDTQKSKIEYKGKAAEIRKNSQAYVFLLSLIQQAPISIGRDELHLLLGGSNGDKIKSDRVGSARQYLLEKFEEINISKEMFAKLIVNEGGDYRITAAVEIEK